MTAGPDWKAVLWALVAGILLGVAFTRALSSPRNFSPERRHGRMAEMMSRKLKLSPEQKVELRRILDAKRQRMHAMRSEVEPKFEELRESTRLEIRAVLTPEQREKLDRLEAKWRKRREKMRERAEPR